MAASRPTPLGHLQPWMGATAILVLSLLSYWPAFDNGFISDDYILLERSEDFPAWEPFRDPPAGFRTTTTASFHLLKKLFGYQSPWFYAFAVLLHTLNCLLLARLAGDFLENRTAGWLAGALLAAAQQPQEAVFWLAAMNELWMSCFVLTGLLLWRRGNSPLAGLAFAAALLSKESAAIFPLLALCLGGKELNRRWIFLAVPLLPFLALWVSTSSQNELVRQGFYDLGFHALPVFFKSLGKLLLPWGVLFLAAGLAVRPRPRPAEQLPAELRKQLLLASATASALLPYILVTYSDKAPSRNLYLGTAIFCCLLSLWMVRIPSRRLGVALLSAYLILNPLYLWLKKDPQYETRAAPTTRLLEHLRAHPPAPLSIQDFPLNPWCGRLTARAVPGWTPELLTVNDLVGAAPPNTILRWNPASNSLKADPRPH